MPSLLALLILGCAVAPPSAPVANRTRTATTATGGTAPAQQRAAATATPTDRASARTAAVATARRRGTTAGAAAPQGVTLGVVVAPAPARLTNVTPGSPAAAAGLQPGDLILRFADRDIHSCDEFLQLAPTLAAGTYDAVIRRGSVEFPLSLTLGPVPPPDSGTPRVGVSFRRGAEVQSFAPGSAAEQAGVQVGDVITAANGQSVANCAALTAFLQAADPAQDVKLAVWRQDHALSITVANAGANLPLRDPASRGTLAGALHRTAYTAPAALEQRLAQFNVLQSAFVDPASGRIVLVGYYDPAYASGPIPYLDLLADAVENPYPAFSLGNPGLGDPVLRQIRSTFDNEFARVSQDPAYGVEWMKGLILPVLTGSADSEERAGLAAKLQAAGISLAEYDAFMKWQATEFNDPKYFPVALGFFRHLCDHAGYGEGAGASLASYLLFASEHDHDALANWAEASGCGDTMARIEREVGEGRDRGQASRELTAVLYSAMLGRLGVPAAQLRRISAGFQQGTAGEEAFVNLVTPSWDRIYRDFTTNKLINGLTFSGASLAARYNFPPLRSTLDTFGARRDSVLMSVFFQADYTLKYVTASPRAAAQVPGHMTSQDYLGTAENRAGAAAGRTPTTGMIRYWIYPADVECDLLPGNSGVRFRTAALRIGAESLGSAGADQRGEAFFRQALADYGTQLTGQFDAYARVYPSLHVMRETAKVIALARWARRTGVRLQLAGAQPTRAALPDWSEGFWGMTYVVRPSGDADTMVVWAQGGVKFDQEVGDGWVQSRPATPEVTNDTLRQLAASTALAEQAAVAAGDGNLEAARNLAERSAQAMTGRIDMSNLPEPVMVPVEGAGAAGFVDQAQVAAAAVASVDRNTAGIQQARQNLADAAPLQQTNPQEYARLEEQAHQLQTRSEQNLQRLQSLLQEYRAGRAPPADVVVDLRGLDPTKPLTVALTRPATPAPPADLRDAVASSPPPAAPPESKFKGMTREQLLAELAKLRGQIDATKAQLLKLNQNIRADDTLYREWQEACKQGKLGLRDTFVDLLVDASIGYLVDRYQEIDRLAQALPDKPAAYIKSVHDARTMLEMLAHAKSTVDLAKLAAQDNETEQEFLDNVRNNMSIAMGELHLDEKLVHNGVLVYKLGQNAFFAGQAWKIGNAVFDLGYNGFEVYTAWGLMDQLDRNKAGFDRAFQSLHGRLVNLARQTDEVEALLQAAPPE